MNWEALVAALVAGLLVYSLYRQFRNSPEAFSKKNFSQGLYILGLLAIALIALIAFCVQMLKN